MATTALTAMSGALGTAFLLTAASGNAAKAADDPATDINLPQTADELTVAPPKDLKDVPIATEPQSFRRFLGIAANPKNPKLLVVLVLRGTSNYVIYRSADAGRSWSDPVPLPQQAASFCCVASGSLAYSPDGTRLYAAYTQLQLERGLTEIAVSGSDDDGTTWAAPVVALSAQDHTEYAHPHIATGLGGANGAWVYLTGGTDRDEGPLIGIDFVRSADGGLTWSAPQNLVRGNVETNPVSGGAVAGGVSGQVLVSWYNPNFCGGNELIQVASSQDHGATFAQPATAAADPSDPNCLGGGTVDVKIGAKGVAHLVYQRVPAMPGEDEGDVGYVWSPPPYTTWSQPVTVNDDTLPHTQLSASLATERCGAATVLHVVWQDPRLSPTASADTRWDVFYARKVARAGAPWSKNVRVTDRSSFDPPFTVLSPGIVPSRGRAVAAWTDSRTADPDAPEKVFGSGILSGVSCP